MTGRSIASLSWLFLLFAGLFVSTTARAQTGYAGVWKAGPSRIAVTVHSWGGDCGPQPQSTTQPGGGTVEITEYGRNIAIHATDRTILSNACWSQNRAIARVSSSFLDGVWSTKCRTPPSDPKSEEGEYVLKVENNGTIQYRDSSNYNWELRSSRCIATIVTTQTLTRSTGTAATNAAAAAAAPTAAPAVAEEEPEVAEPKNCTPGVPAKIVMRPKRAQIEPGQRVCIRAVVVDAAGCTLKQPDVRWTLQHSPALRGSQSSGCFEAASTAAEAEGEFKLVAQIEGLRADAVVEVSTVDFSDLMAKHIETGAITGRANAAPAATAQSQTAARVQTRANTEAPSIAPLVAIGAGGLLVIVGLLWWLLRKRAVVAVDGVSDRMSYRPPAGSMRPSQMPAASPAPSSRPAASASAPAPVAVAAPGENWICPTCRRGSPMQQRVCNCTPAGTPLMPYQEFAKLGRDAPAQERKVCGGCGNQCPLAAVFCGGCGRRF